MRSRILLDADQNPAVDRQVVARGERLARVAIEIIADDAAAASAADLLGVRDAVADPVLVEYAFEGFGLVRADLGPALGAWDWPVEDDGVEHAYDNLFLYSVVASIQCLRYHSTFVRSSQVDYSCVPRYPLCSISYFPKVIPCAKLGANNPQVAIPLQFDGFAQNR